MWRPDSVYDPSGHLDEGVMHAWLDGALADDPAREVESHAAACAACAARIAEARGLIAGAGRVLGALDGEMSGAGRRVSAATARVGEGSSGRSGMIGAGRPMPDARRRWTTRRISLAAAAVLVFAAGTVVLRDELGDGRGVREAVVADRATSAESRTEEHDFAAAPQLTPEAGAGVAGAPGMVDAGRAANAAPSAPPSAPPSAGAPSGTPALAPAPAAPSSALLGSVASDAGSAMVLADARPTAQRAADPDRATAREADRRSGVEATVATGVSGSVAASKPATSPQRMEGGALFAAPVLRHPGAWVLGCWRVAGSDTLLHFDRGGLAVRSFGPAAEWHGAVRISPTTRSVVEWRLDGDSTGPARVRSWGASRDLLLWPGRDSLEAAVVPDPDRQGSALTEQQRIDREARRPGRSAAYERQLVLVRQEEGICSP